MGMMVAKQGNATSDSDTSAVCQATVEEGSQISELGEATSRWTWTPGSPGTSVDGLDKGSKCLMEGSPKRAKPSATV